MLALASLFSTPGGAPMAFHIPDHEPERAALVAAIESHGGRVVDSDEGIALLTLAFNPYRTTYAPDFITKLVEAGKVLRIDRFRVTQPPPDKTVVMVEQGYIDAAMTQLRAVPDVSPEMVARQARARAKPVRVLTAGKNHFTSDEDARILEYVRRNPFRRNTHRLFEEIAKELGNHTGNSVRYRYRNFLQARLEYVYKVDPLTNEVVYDANNNPIPAAVERGTLKNKFTAADDFRLCCALRDHGITTLIHFYKRFSESNPGHTALAWRDRYRKFISIDGYQKYIDYYERCVENNISPEPLRNLTSRRAQGLLRLLVVKTLAEFGHEIKPETPETPVEPLLMEPLEITQDMFGPAYASKDPREVVRLVAELAGGPDPATHIHEYTGLPVALVQRAFAATSDDATVVPAYIKAVLENGLNTDVAGVKGVWSLHDDELLQSGRPAERRRLVKFHGEASVARREVYLLE